MKAESADSCRREAVAEKNKITKEDRLKRVGACCGISGFFLACLLAVLNYREHLAGWQVKLLGVLLLGAIVITLAYGSVWVWIYNYFSGRRK